MRLDRRRRGIARGPARGRDAAPRRASTGGSSSSAPSRTCRTTGRRCRRSCSPGTGSTTRSCCARTPYDDLDLELRLGVGATALDVAGRIVTLAGGHRARVRRPGHRDRLDAAHAARPAGARRRLHAAHDRRLPSPSATRLDAGAAGLRDRRGVHRRRGRGDVPQARPGRHGARGAAAADGARRRAGARRACSRGCTATTASTCGCGVTLEAIEGDGRVERVPPGDGERRRVRRR